MDNPCKAKKKCVHRVWIVCGHCVDTNTLFIGIARLRRDTSLHSLSPFTKHENHQFLNLRPGSPVAKDFLQLCCFEMELKQRERSEHRFLHDRERIGQSLPTNF